MDLAGTLPSTPLCRSDTVAIRSRDEVEALIVLGATSIDARRGRHDGPATEAVALIDGTVYGLSYDDSSWSQEILRRDADRHDHLESTLQWSG